PATRAAIQKCQLEHGLMASGAVDRATAALIDQVSVKRVAPEKGTESALATKPSVPRVRPVTGTRPESLKRLDSSHIRKDDDAASTTVLGSTNFERNGSYSTTRASQTRSATVQGALEPVAVASPAPVSTECELIDRRPYVVRGRVLNADRSPHLDAQVRAF